MTGMQLYIMYCEELPPIQGHNHQTWDELPYYERDAWERLAKKINAGDLP